MMSASEREELAVKADWLIGQRAQDLKGFVHSTPDGPRIHTTDLKLVPVLATDTHAEYQPPGASSAMLASWRATSTG